MIRILQIGLSPTYYGTESVIMNLYRNINTNEIQFDFLYDHHVGAIDYENEIYSRGGKVYRQYYKRKEKHNDDYISPQIFYEMHPDIAGVHYNVNNHTPYIRYMVEAYKRNLPIRIIHAHSSNYFNSNISWKDKVYGIYAKYMSGICTNMRLACSEEAGNFIFNCDFRVFPNAIDTDKFSFNKEVRYTLRKQIHAENKIVLAFIGRLHPQKNPLYSLEIVKRLSSDKYILLVLGDGELYDSMVNEIKNSCLNNVYMLGRRNDVYQWLSAIDILLMPSKFEGLGVSLIEAQSCGVKCIGSNTIPKETKITDIISYCSLEGIGEWIDCIEKYEPVLNREKYKSIVENAGYGIKSSSMILKEIYKSLL